MKRALILAWLVVVIWAWWPVLSVGFLADDYEWLPVVSQLSGRQVWQLFWPETAVVRYRPLVGLSFWFDYRLWGFRPLGYHLSNLFFHLLGVLAVFVLGRLVWSWGRKKEEALGLCVGLVAAVLFAVNPLFPETVTWISGRHDLLAATLLLWCLVFFIRFLQSDFRRLELFGIAFTFGTLALFAKETAVVIPLLVCTIYIYYVLLINRKMRSRRFQIILEKSGWVLPFLLAIGLYIWVSSLALGRPVWAVRGLPFVVSRPFLLWVLLSCIFSLGAWGKRPFIKGKTWLPWLGVGMSLLPVSMFPTQLRFLYLPSAFGAIWLAFLVFGAGKRLGKMAVGLVFVVCSLFSVGWLYSRNLAWVEASRLHQQVSEQTGNLILQEKARLVYVFNLPDHVGEVQLFRSHVKEAVFLERGWLGKTFPHYPIDIVVGPMTVDLGKTEAAVVDVLRVKLRSDSGFVVFEPAIARRNDDGSLEIDWAGEWQATISADRKEAVVKLPHQLDEEGVLGVVFEDGEVRRLL